MTQLTHESPRFKVQGDRSEYPMAAGVKIYEGSAVGLNPATGYARQLEAGDTFVGFAEWTNDNAGGADGDDRTRTYYQGAVELAVTGLVITSVGANVIATDGNTFTMTPGTGNTIIGKVRRFVSAGVGVVEYSGTDSAVT